MYIFNQLCFHMGVGLPLPLSFQNCGCVGVEHQSYMIALMCMACLLLFQLVTRMVAIDPVQGTPCWTAFVMIMVSIGIMILQTKDF